MSSPLEIVAVVFSLLCTYFSIRKSVWCWILGNVAVVAYFLLFYQAHLFADMALQVVYFVQGGYGVYAWWQGKKSKESFVRVLSIQQILAYGVGTLAGAACIGWLLDHYTTASSAYVDAFASLLSLTANWLLARRYLQNWFFWIAADLVYVGLFWHKDLYLSSGIYFFFLVLCVKGYWEWRKSIHTKEVLS